MSEIDDAAANLARTTPLSFEQAKLALTRAGSPTTGMWIDETKWSASAMPDTETDPHIFMTAEGIKKADLGEALREYRNLETWDSSPWAREELGVLSTDFINWYRWERL